MADPSVREARPMMLAQTLHWREPLWLLLALYPAAIFILAYVSRRWRRSQYADVTLLPWAQAAFTAQKQRHYWQQLSHLLAWCCFAIAMAGPRIAEKIYQPQHANDAQVMIVLDLSQSMSAKDMLPNRLQRARLALLDFLHSDEPQRIGLTVFAARPHLLSPMTYDKAVIRHYLAALSPTLLPTAGSNISAALLFAAKQFSAPTTPPHSRSILLISDGDSASSIRTEKIQTTSQQLLERGIHVYALGVGTAAGQPVVARLAKDAGRVQTAVSTLQRGTLQQYARLTRGGYTDISDDATDWQKLESLGLGKLAGDTRARQDNHPKIFWHELYHLPLLLGVLLFIFSLLTKVSLRRGDPGATTLAFILLVGCFVITTPPAMAETITYAQAYQIYQKGEYKKARRLFARLTGFASRLGEANALYRLGDYDNARDTYIQAVLIAKTDHQRATALFNLANSYYQLKDFAQAEKLYSDVLHYQPQYPAVQTNIKLARKQFRLQQAALALTYRPGQGPRQSRAANNLDVNNSRLSLGESSQQQRVPLPEAGISTSSTIPVLGQSKLASRQVVEDTDADWTYRLNTAAAIRAHQSSLRPNDAYVWKRLFEQEEGFPAPVPLPHPVAGISPW